MKLILLIILINLFNLVCFADPNLKLLKKIKLSEDEVLIQAPSYFSVTEDECYLISDLKAGNVKFFDSKGNFVKTIGRKGYGPNELAKPHISFYNNNKYYIYDYRHNKIYLYHRHSTFDFKRIQTITYTEGLDDIFVDGNTIYISGCKVDKESEYNCLYSIDIKKPKTYKYLMKSYIKFALDSNVKFKKEAFKKTNLSVIGRNGLFDIQKGFAYFVWEGDLKIFKINLKTKQIKTFGKKTHHYIKPYSNKKLENAFFSPQITKLSELQNKMSYLGNIKCTKNYLLVFYNIPCESRDEESHMLQFYTFEGVFINEIPFYAFPNSINVNKEKNLLYAYKIKTDEDLDSHHYILKYKVIE